MKYSIITPVYNRADCILRCLESVERNVANGHPDVEHIVVDDGSTDGTSTLLETYAQTHPHVVFIPLASNRGTNAARNTAIRAAKGSYCLLLDSDDYLIDEAINIIDRTVDSHPQTRHFCFAPDDMQQAYAHNPLLNKSRQQWLTFDDFLLRRVGGDFIHVIATDIMQCHPFDEQLRIYEGVFFLSFYQEARQMLFTNEVVTIRERSRADSVTREVIRENKTVVERHVRYLTLLTTRFRASFMASEEGREQLWRHLVTLAENQLLISHYQEALHTLEQADKLHLHPIPLRLRLGCKLHAGPLLFLCLRTLLYIKYHIIRRRLA